jgi:hypothetical protein
LKTSGFQKEICWEPYLELDKNGERPDKNSGVKNKVSSLWRKYYILDIYVEIGNSD